MQQDAKALSQVEVQHRELQAVVGRAREQAAEKRTINAQLKKEMFNLREQLNELEQLSTCPTCRRAMDAEHDGQKLMAEMKVLLVHPVVRHEQPTGAPLLHVAS